MTVHAVESTTQTVRSGFLDPTAPAVASVQPGVRCQLPQHLDALGQRGHFRDDLRGARTAPPPLPQRSLLDDRTGRDRRRRATATSTLVILDTASTAGPASAIAIRSTSTIVQQLVKTGETWRIARRSVSDA